MEDQLKIVFICEHGAAKSILAAAFFNQLASQMGLKLQAVARGTNPDRELSPQTVMGLTNDGLTPMEVAPKKLTPADLYAAKHVVTFCALPTEYQQPASIEHWDDVPPVSDGYEKARDVIVAHIHQMLKR